MTDDLPATTSIWPFVCNLDPLGYPHYRFPAFPDVRDYILSPLNCPKTSSLPKRGHFQILIANSRSVSGRYLRSQIQEVSILHIPPTSRVVSEASGFQHKHFLFDIIETFRYFRFLAERLLELSQIHDHCL